jgi:beta-lactamase class A
VRAPYDFLVLRDQFLINLGLEGSAFAASIDDSGGVGFREDELVSPASVMKVQVALSIENLIASGVLDGSAPVHVPEGRRTPGPVGMSLFHDEVSISLRDLVVMMLTISDNVATDALIGLAGLDAINQSTLELGLSNTEINSGIGQMLDSIAFEIGFKNYEELSEFVPTSESPRSQQEILRSIAQSAALDPSRGTHTTARDSVRLLQAIWTDRAGDPVACQRVRRMMGQQLSQARIASGFDAGEVIAAKSGGLLGVVRNEAGVVTTSDGRSFAVAIFTRLPMNNRPTPRSVDECIGRTARLLVDELRNG